MAAARIPVGRKARAEAAFVLASAIEEQQVGVADADRGDDCGCSSPLPPPPPLLATRYGGEPSPAARALDAREALRGRAVYRLDGSAALVDDLIGKPDQETTSVVVFLRSLG
jgi:hypothetical protein